MALPVGQQNLSLRIIMFFYSVNKIQVFVIVQTTKSFGLTYDNQSKFTIITKKISKVVDRSNIYRKTIEVLYFLRVDTKKEKRRTYIFLQK